MIEKISIFLIFAVLVGRTAHAYIDPGTGSMMIQIISAFLLTGIFTMKLWVKNVKHFFTKKPKDTINNEQQESSK